AHGRRPLRELLRWRLSGGAPPSLAIGFGAEGETMTVARARPFAVALLLTVIVAGCPCKNPPPPPPPPAPPVYNLCIEASPRLNWYSESSQTLYVRLFQLSSLDAFQEAEPGRLLDAQANVPGLQGTPMERTIYPGSKIAVEVRQHPEAQYLGVVAGYYRVDGLAKTHLP